MPTATAKRSKTTKRRRRPIKEPTRKGLEKLVRDGEPFDLKAVAATWPKPTGGQLIVDDELQVIHGVLICSVESANGFRWARSAREDIRDILNDIPVSMHDGHFKVDASETNGFAAPNGYFDGEFVRASYVLNPYNTKSDEIKFDARVNPQNIAVSPEIREKDLVEKTNADGIREVVEVRSIRNFSLVTDGGTNNGIAESRGKPMDIKTPEDVKSEFPAVYDQIIESVRAEMSGEEATATIEILQKENGDLKSELDQIKVEAAQKERIAEIKEQWAGAFEGVNLEAIPDTDEGKRLKAKAELSDELATALAAATPDDASKQIEDIAQSVKDVLVLTEASHKSTFADLDPPASSELADLGSYF